MSDGIPGVAETLRELREQCDPVSEARKEVLPYARPASTSIRERRLAATSSSTTGPAW